MILCLSALLFLYSKSFIFPSAPLVEEKEKKEKKQGCTDNIWQFRFIPNKDEHTNPALIEATE